ncbi:MAG: hypothetical protein AAGB46_14375 [Verrucomicrobiota bacterium]
MNRVSRSSTGYGESGRVRSRSRVGGAQSVNISQETLDRIAREKLENALKYKISYNQRGAFESKTPAGIRFSAKA